MRKSRWLLGCLSLFGALSWSQAVRAEGLGTAPRVEVTDDHLVIDGKPEGFLFGAELQYFRARGGAGRNVPRDEVMALWRKLVDRFEEARMNTATFYVPWDFHEPVEGVFDFEGTLDQDGDGNADYPSRDVKAFIDLLVSRGVKRIMVRPGPYINARWGPTGFGAIPLWFLDGYPEALAGTQTASRERTASFGHPLYRDRVGKWFAAFHDQVLKHYASEGGPVVFLQIDNESNYFWDSVYERDYAEASLARYRAFLERAYGGDVSRLNSAYGATLSSFAAVEPPRAPDARDFSASWHQDWYRFHDAELRDYYEFLKKTWHDLGVTDQQLLITSCDSINAPAHGLLPNLRLRQEHGLTLTTMNIYPKTYGTLAESTMNTPMKAAHDASLIGAAHRQFYGTGGDWVMSSETVGGWVPPTEVSLAARQHTYGSLMGSGVKAMIIYFFHEGWNWDGLEKSDSELFFQAPLDKDMYPTAAYDLVKYVGETLASGLGDRIMASEPTRTPVLLVADSESPYPTPDAPDVIEARSTESAGLYGLFREAGALPTIGYPGAMSDEEIAAYRLVVWRYDGEAGEATRARIARYVQNGGRVLVVGDALPEALAGGEGVVQWRASIARDWNGDAYGALPHAAKTLATARQLLEEAQIEPLVRVVAKDSEPYLHAWLRGGKGEKAGLLFVENFLKSERVARIAVASAALPAGKRFRLTQVLARGPEDESPVPLIVTRGELTRAGVNLTVKGDAVEIYSVEVVP